MFEKELQSMGLTEGEAKVYESLLFLGSSTVGPIVKRSKVSASNIYEILERLTFKGLVSYVIREKTKYFQAADPNRITDYLESQEMKIRKNKETLKNLIPFLSEIKSSSSKLEEVELFIGTKGLITAYETLFQDLRRGDKAYFFYAYSKTYLESSLKFYSKIMPYFKKIGVHWDGITHIDYKKISLANKVPKSVVNERYVNFPIPGNIGVYADRTLIIIWNLHPTGIFIRSQEVADNFKAYFASLWRVAKN